jgi:hypothetical protein
MHSAERVLLWSIIIFIIFLLFFRQTSGYASSFSLLDATEFKYFPTDVKAYIKDSLNTIMQASGDKFTQEYKKSSQAVKDQFRNKIKNATDSAVAQIHYMSLSDIMQDKGMSEKASGPAMPFPKMASGPAMPFPMMASGPAMSTQGPAMQALGPVMPTRHSDEIKSDISGHNI